MNAKETLEGKVALVTGGSRGIGAAIATRLARSGADVAISYAASEEAAQGVVAGLRELGRDAEAFRADSGDAGAVKRLVADTLERFGRLDILVNNAGVYPTGSVLETSEDDYDRAFDVNVKGLFVAVREAATHMNGDGGRIVNLSSVFGGERTPFPGISLYSATKAAVSAFTRAWARDLAERGITVNAVQPGPIDTDMNPADGEFAPAVAGLTALGRFGRAEEIASVVDFLASPQASYVTGETINVDGGLNA